MPMQLPSFVSAGLGDSTSVLFRSEVCVKKCNHAPDYYSGAGKKMEQDASSAFAKSYQSLCNVDIFSVG
ncbi:MAG: hypothetical protein ACOYLN_13755, partial [Blastocatellia bacterium]